MIAIPWAGAGAAVLLPWSERLGAETDLQIVRLPGRENRFTEPRMTSIDAVTAALAPVVRGLPPLPTALFGYSLGALIAFELARVLEAQGSPVRLLAVGGCAAPHQLPPRPPVSELDDAAFAATVRDLDGTPPEIFDHPELLALLLPTLRSDFTMLENYAPRPGTVSCPIVTFTGRSDEELTDASVAAWAELSDQGAEHRYYDGGHFFLADSGNELLIDLRAELDRHVAPEGLPPHA